MTGTLKLFQHFNHGMKKIQERLRHRSRENSEIGPDLRHCFQNSFGLVTLFVQTLVQNDFKNCSDPPLAPSSPLPALQASWMPSLVGANNRTEQAEGMGVDETKENGDYFFW